jgi:hypothetical protein
MHSNLLIFLALFICFMLLPRLWGLALALWSSLFQLFTLPLFGFYPSVALLSALSFAPKLPFYWRSYNQWPVLFFLALLLMQTCSLLWSPDLKLGLATIIYELPFLLLLIVTDSIARVYPDKLIKIIKVYAYLSIISVFLTLFFRIFKDLNLSYFKSPFAGMVLNPHAVGSFFAKNKHGYHLTLWPGKPRGLLMNPDSNGGFLGICALIFWGIGSYCHSIRLKVIAALNWITVFATFSTAAIILAIVLPITIFTFLHSQKIKSSLIRLCQLIGVFITLSIIFVPSLWTYILFKVQSRLILWKMAVTFSHGHLLGGLGFGGWEILYASYRSITPDPYQILSPDLPPHNTLIQLWSQSGMIAVCIGICFIVSMLWLCRHSFQQATEKNVKTMVLCVSAATAWIFLQGLGENWGIIGEAHIQPLIAVAFACMLRFSYRA